MRSVVDGRYHLLEALESGASGPVFRALDIERDGKPVCLKWLPASEYSEVSGGHLDAILGAQFPGLARILDWGQIPTHSPVLIENGEDLCGFYLVSEWIEGASIQEALAFDDLRDREAGAVHLAAHLLRAVGFLHEIGLAHRDIKIENVIVDRRVSPNRWRDACPLVLLDFGMSFAVGGETLASGTPGSMAPELWTGQRPSFQSDLYAVGALLAHVCLGRPWFEVGLNKGSGEAVGSMELVGLHRNEEAGQRARDAILDSKHPLASLALRLLRPDPSERPECAGDALVALAESVTLEFDLETKESRAGRILSSIRARSFSESSPYPRCVVSWDSPLEKRQCRLGLKRQMMSRGFRPLEVRWDSGQLEALREGIASRGLNDSAVVPSQFSKDDLIDRLAADRCSLILDRVSTLSPESVEWLKSVTVPILLIPSSPGIDVANNLAADTDSILSEPWGIEVRDLSAWLERSLKAPAHPSLIKALETSQSSYSEAMLQEWLAENLLAGRLRFASSGALPVEALPWPLDSGLKTQHRFSLLERDDQRLVVALFLLGKRARMEWFPPESFPNAQYSLRHLDLEELILVESGQGEPIYALKEADWPQILAPLLEEPSFQAKDLARSLWVWVKEDARFGGESRAFLQEFLGEDPALIRSLRIEAAVEAIENFRLDQAKRLLDLARSEPLESPWIYARAQWSLVAGEEQEIFDRLRKHWSEEEDPVLQARMLVLLGQHAETTGQLDEAVRWLEEAAQHPSLPESSRHSVEVNLARLEYRMGRFDSAQDRTQSLLEDETKAGSVPTKIRARALNIQALMAQDLGRHEEASDRLSELQALAVELGPSYQASVYISAARTEYRLGRLTEAIARLKRASDLFSEEGERAYLGLCLQNMAEYQWVRGRLSRAKELLQKSREALRSVSDSGLHANADRLEGLLAMTEGDLERAEVALSRAAERYGQAAEPSGVIETILEKARLQARSGGDWKSVLEACEAFSDDDWNERLRAMRHRIAMEAGHEEPQEFRRRLVAQLPRLNPREALEATVSILRFDLRFLDADQGAEFARAARSSLAAMNLGATGEYAQGLLRLHECVGGSSEESHRGLCQSIDELARYDRKDLWLSLFVSFLRWFRSALISPSDESRVPGIDIGWVHDGVRKALDLDQRLQRGQESPFIREVGSEIAKCGLDWGASREFLRKYDSLQKLKAVTKAINNETDPTKLLDLILERGMDFVGAKRSFLVLVKKDRTEIRVARHLNEEEVSRPELSISHTVAGEVARTGQPILLSNAVEDDDWRASASISHLKLLSILCVPLKANDEVIGALYVDDPGVINRFDGFDLERLQDFSDHAAIALGKSLLVQENVVKAKQLDQSRRKIERLNAKLRQKLDHTSQELNDVKAALKRTRAQLFGETSDLVAQSPSMRRELAGLDRIVHAPFPVLVLGESGTGKELIARLIHEKGGRAESEMHTLNCAALPEALVESELFGHRKGAFTGAETDRAGVFESADGGTLFLDEVGDMSLDVQKRFLRVLQFGEYYRIGDAQARKVNVRIVAATHRDLADRVKQGEFREDLYYRLNVLRIQVPPLRDRREDIPLLITRLVDRMVKEEGLSRLSFTPRAVDRFVSYPWPGNVRELENVIRNLVVLSPSRTVDVEDLPDRVGQFESGSRPLEIEGLGEKGQSLKEVIGDFERRIIAKTLEQCGGNKSEAARKLGMTPRNLYKRLERLGLS